MALAVADDRIEIQPVAGVLMPVQAVVLLDLVELRRLRRVDDRDVLRDARLDGGAGTRTILDIEIYQCGFRGKIAVTLREQQLIERQVRRRSAGIQCLGLSDLRRRQTAICTEASGDSGAVCRAIDGRRQKLTTDKLADRAEELRAGELVGGRRIDVRRL